MTARRYLAIERGVVALGAVTGHVLGFLVWHFFPRSVAERLHRWAYWHGGSAQ